MKLLWTISNWKRTGPLEPSLDLAVAMQARGHDVHVAVGRAPDARRDRADVTARERGLPLAATGVTLAKHSFPLRNWRDVRRLRRWVARERPDGIVSTLRNDHVLGLRAAAGARVPVVRLWFGDGETPLDPRDAKALRASAGALAFSREAARQLRDLGLGSRVHTAHPPLDVAAVRRRAGEGSAGRSHYGVPPDVLLLGLVARIQLHRRFELLWEAVARLKVRGVPFHLLAVGRGTNQEIVAHGPVKAMGLEDVVTFTGYLRGAEYAATVAAFDAQILLVPGSDPTCRALREGMALGVPGVTSERGMLPEIVTHEKTGLVVPEEPEALAAAFARLAADPEARRRMGAAAAERATTCFAAPVVAGVLEAALAAEVC